MLDLIDGNTDWSEDDKHYNEVLEAYLSGEISNVAVYEQVVRDWEKGIAG